MAENCLFCRIANGQIPAEIVADAQDALAFRDINAQAPTHILVIPKLHIASLDAADDPFELGRLLHLAARVARDQGLAKSGYRVVVNTNEHGGQTVQHLHLHILGGRQMTWPPG